MRDCRSSGSIVSGFGLAALLLLAGCAGRQAEGPELAQAAGWRWRIEPAGDFDLATAVSPQIGDGRSGNGETLVVYLEGDGLAYARPGQPAMDPTPRDPVALKLALADPSGRPTAWIGRPCQYTLPNHGRNCSVEDWTTARYSPAAVESIGAAVDRLEQESGARHLVLAGYSGGGAIAVLLAARRRDVTEIVTVAADLDLAYWTGRDHLAALPQSLDPADVASQVATIPQIHFTGAADDNVGTDVARSFLNRLPSSAPARLVEVRDFTHGCCWARDWASLLTRHGDMPVAGENR